MNRWAQTMYLARRDFMARAKSRAFQVTLLLIVGLVVLVIPLIAYIVPEPAPVTIALTRAAPAGTEQALVQIAAEAGLPIEVTGFDDESLAEQALRDGAADVVYTGSRIVWLEKASTSVNAIVNAAAARVEVDGAAGELGLTPAELEELVAPPELDQVILAPPDPEEEPRRIAALVGLILLYMSILIFGQFVATGVLEEKQNRVVEVVLSRVEPAQVLVSKVAGIGALGLVQLLVLGGAVWGATYFVDLPDISLPSIGGPILAGVILWFLLGYTLYAVVYAALGATISRQEDLQGAVMIPIVFLLPGFFIGQIAQEAPDALAVVVASYLPFWSPMVMPVRAAVGAVTPWEVALAVAIIAITTYFVVRIGARLYRGAVLEIGERVKLREAWRANP